jgi:hypothetical protein
MRFTILSRVDHVNRFFQYQAPHNNEECSEMLLQNLLLAHSNSICQDLYNSNCTCAFCNNPHDGMLNCARLVQQEEDDDTIFIKNMPIVCCKHCTWIIPFELVALNRVHGFTFIWSNWSRPETPCLQTSSPCLQTTGERIVL